MQQTSTEPGLQRLAEVLANAERYWFYYNFGAGLGNVDGHQMVSFSEVVPTTVYALVSDFELLALSDKGHQATVLQQLTERRNRALDVAVATTLAGSISISEALKTLGKGDTGLLWQRLFEHVPMLKTINRLQRLPRSQVSAQELAQLVVDQVDALAPPTGTMCALGRTVKEGHASSLAWQRWKRSLDYLTVGAVLRAHVRQTTALQESGVCDANDWALHSSRGVIGSAETLYGSLQQMYEFTDSQWAAAISMVFKKAASTGPDALRDICQVVSSI